MKLVDINGVIIQKTGIKCVVSHVINAELKWPYGKIVKTSMAIHSTSANLTCSVC
jgi:hypothetical protein